MLGGDRWAALSYVAEGNHEICGETVKLMNGKFSLFGGHRVRLYRFKNNVHWKIPSGVELDITDVPPAQAPRRQGGNR